MPEKSIQEVSRAWREQYEKGKLAFEKNNLGYALDILTQVLQKEPGFFDCRQALRAAQFKKAGSGGTGLFRKLVGSTNPKLLQAQIAARNNPAQALHLAEEILNGDPHNLGAHKVLAEAALALDFPKTAVLSLEIAHKHSAKDRDVAMKLARALANIGQAKRAEAIVEELNRAYPSDPEIAQALKDMAASRTMTEGGYGALADGQGSYRDILRNEQEAVTLEQERREHKSEDVSERLIAEYEARLPNEPQNLRLVRSIAELYAERKDFEKALEFYQRLASAENADPTLERAIADLKVKQLEHTLSELDPQSADYAAAVDRLNAEKQAFRLDDAKRRAERYPNDLALRFDLGQLLLEAGRIGEAIQEFQKAQNNPHKRIAAMAALAQCFSRRGMHDLAARTLQNAIKEKLVFDDEKKDLIYALGCALDGLGRKAESIEQFKLIYEVDIGYRDIAARVDAHYAALAATPPGDTAA
jgi:tetratricopeptide (TPR) repeat protein